MQRAFQQLLQIEIVAGKDKDLIDDDDKGRFILEMLISSIPSSNTPSLALICTCPLSSPNGDAQTLLPSILVLYACSQQSRRPTHSVSSQAREEGDQVHPNGSQATGSSSQPSQSSTRV